MYSPRKNDIPYGKKDNLRPIDYAAINAGNIIIWNFNYRPQKKLHHAPFPMLLSVLYEIEKKFPDEIKITSGNKFRSSNDLPVATTFHAYYSLAIGRGKLRDVQARYIDIGNPLFVFLVHPYSPLRRGKYMFFCLNEIFSIRLFSVIRDQIIKRFLNKMFS